MNAKKPELQDFGITTEEYDLYSRKGTDPSGRLFLIAFLAVFLVAFVAIFLSTQDFVGAFWIGVGTAVFPAIGIAALIQAILKSKKRSHLMKSSVASQIKLYEEALVYYRSKQEEAKRAQREADRARWEAERARERAEWAAAQAERERLRKLSEYWTSLGGVAFERELANLYRRLGYHVESTPGSGDQGIDLIVKKDGLTTVVQCKAHKSPVGPAIARELYGSLVAYGADLAILASTGGFTQGVKDFVRGKPIALISAYELAALGERGEALPEQSSPPICPAQGCGKTMVTRTGRYGTFWGCPAFPKCKGTREYRGQ